MKKIYTLFLLLSFIAALGQGPSNPCRGCFPSQAGHAGQYLKTNGAGGLSWAVASASLTNGNGTTITGAGTKVDVGGILTRNSNTNPNGSWWGVGDSLKSWGLLVGNCDSVGFADSSIYFLGQDVSLNGSGRLSAMFDLGATVISQQINLDGTGESINLRDGVKIHTDTFNVDISAGDSTTGVITAMAFNAKDLDSANTAGWNLKTDYLSTGHQAGFLSRTDHITGYRTMDWFYDNDTIDIARMNVAENAISGEYRDRTTIGKGVNAIYNGWRANDKYYSFGIRNSSGYIDPYNNIDFNGFVLSDSAGFEMLWRGSKKFGIDTFGKASFYSLILPDTTFAPLTTETVTITRTSNTINPAGTIAALTFVFPASPANGQRIELSFTQIVTLITWPASVHASVLTTAAAAGASIKLKYNSTLSKWVND